MEVSIGYGGHNPTLSFMRESECGVELSEPQPTPCDSHMEKGVYARKGKPIYNMEH